MPKKIYDFLIDDKIAHAVLMLHPSCNMICSFCVTENGFDAISFDQAIHFLKNLKAAGIQSIILGGGEPFTWKHDLFLLAKEAKAMGFVVQVGTNGINVPDNFEHSEVIDRYILPLESMEPQVHNTMRKFQHRHHGLILDRLAKLKKAGKEVTLSTVITQKNISSLEQTAEYLREYQSSGGHIHAWHLYQFIPEGRGGRPNADELSISREDYKQVCQRVKEMELGFTIYKRSNMYQSKTVEFFWYQDGKLRMGDKVNQDPLAQLKIHNADHLL